MTITFKPKETWQRKGDGHHKAKVTARQVVNIRKAHAAGKTYKALAKQYGLDPSSVASICKRETWAHIP